MCPPEHVWLSWMSFCIKKSDFFLLSYVPSCVSFKIRCWLWVCCMFFGVAGVKAATPVWWLQLPKVKLPSLFSIYLLWCAVHGEFCINGNLLWICEITARIEWNVEISVRAAEVSSDLNICLRKIVGLNQFQENTTFVSSVCIRPIKTLPFAELSRRPRLPICLLR